MTVKLRIARVATVPFFLNSQLSSQIESLIDVGHEVSAITSPDGSWGRLNNIKGLKRVPIQIHRRPAPIGDTLTLFKLYRLFTKERFDVVHSTTPKAGLLCAIAARLAGVPLRIHTFTGQTWATKTGLGRWVLAKMDSLIIRLDSHVYADSFTQRDFLIEEGVAKIGEIEVLGQGSLAGVDLVRFSIEHSKPNSIRHALGVKLEDFVITYIGRLTRDKGLLELLDVFELLVERYPSAHLLLVGPLEDTQVEDAIRNLQDVSNLHVIGPTSTPEKYLSATDVLCLPSYREGFGTVVIEAAAMRVPTIGSDIAGLRDAVVDGETGLLVESKNTESLSKALEYLIEDRSYCEELGNRAYKRCVEEFDSKHVSRLVADEYVRLWQSRDSK